MRTTGINAIDVIIDDLSKVTTEYVRILGFEDCGSDETGHMTKVGDFHIYFRLGQANPSGAFVPVLATDSVPAMRDHCAQAGLTVSPLQVFSPEFKMFEVQDSSGNTWSFAGS